MTTDERLERFNYYVQRALAECKGIEHLEQEMDDDDDVE